MRRTPYYNLLWCKTYIVTWNRLGSCRSSDNNISYKQSIELLSCVIKPTPAAINLLLSRLHDVTIRNYDIIAQFRHRASSDSGNFCGRLQTEQKATRKTASKYVDEDNQIDEN